MKKTIIVSLMGVDGSGKTTLAKKLNKTFKYSKYLHFKPYIIFKDRRTVVKNPQKQKKSSFLLSLLRLLSWYISYKFFFYKEKGKKIFIFDRYAHDILVDPLRYKHSLSKNLTKFFLNFFPQPNLWLFLKPSFKTIKSRKFELSDQELRRQIRDYSIFFFNRKNVLKLNSNNQNKILITKVKEKIYSVFK